MPESVADRARQPALLRAWSATCRRQPTPTRRALAVQRRDRGPADGDAGDLCVPGHVVARVGSRTGRWLRCAAPRSSPSETQRHLHHRVGVGVGVAGDARATDRCRRRATSSVGSIDCSRTTGTPRPRCSRCASACCDAPAVRRPTRCTRSSSPRRPARAWRGRSHPTSRIPDPMAVRTGARFEDTVALTRAALAELAGQ